MANTKRIENLDLLRAFAILLVVYFHTVQMVFGSIIVDKSLFNLGKFGVNVFFVLSGFLISTIYLRNREVKPFKFWLNRFLRIYPPYVITLLISWLVVAYFRNEKFHWGYLLMIQNFYTSIPYFLASWSLCIEEHFYLFFTAVIFTFSNLKPHKIIWLTLLILSCIFRYLSGNPVTDTFGYYSTATYFQMDSLAFGVLAGYFVAGKPIKIKASTFTIGILLILFIGSAYILCTYTNLLIYTFGYTLLNCITTFLLIQLYYHKPLLLAQTSFINWTAKMAFSIYLVHPLCIHFGIMIFNKFGINNSPALYISILITIYTTSFIFYKTIEKPSLNLRNMLTKYA